MAEVTQDQFDELMKSAPQGYNPADLADFLVKNGHYLKVPGYHNPENLNNYYKPGNPGEAIASDVGQNPNEGLTTEAVRAVAGTPQAAGKSIRENVNKTQEILGEAGIPPKLSALGLTPAATVGSLLDPQTTTEKIGSGTLGVISMAGGPEGVSNAYNAAAGMLRSGFADLGGDQLLSAFSRVNPRFMNYALKNPEVLSGNETMAQVGSRMGEYFNKFGIDTSSEEMKNLFKSNYFPGENEVSTLDNKFLDPILTKVRNGDKVSESELVLAERAANAMTRSTKAASNPSLMSYARGAKNFLMQKMEDSGMTELGDLKKDYFGALVRDSFSDLLPQNKQGNANALSTLLMTKKFKDAFGALTEGRFGAATSNALQGALFSPAAIGSGIKLLSNPELGGPNIAAQFSINPARIASEAGEAARTAGNRLLSLSKDERGSLFPEPLGEKPISPSAELSSPNVFPEPKLSLGGAGDYISAMVRNGAKPEDVEEFIRQYQFGNDMPGVKAAYLKEAMKQARTTWGG